MYVNFGKRDKVHFAGFVVFPYRIEQRKVSPFVNSWLSTLIIRTKNCNEDFLAFWACQLFKEDSFSLEMNIFYFLLLPLVDTELIVVLTRLTYNCFVLYLKTLVRTWANQEKWNVPNLFSSKPRMKSIARLQNQHHFAGKFMTYLKTPRIFSSGPLKSWCELGTNLTSKSQRGPFTLDSTSSSSLWWWVTSLESPDQRKASFMW